MQPLSAAEIRARFLDFFAEKDHLKIPEASILPRNDPTLLFVNSGMAPMKNYFLGLEKPPHPRLANVQPCVRTTDIEDVGDRHHLTMFEMLGSWSIGDYYKDLAIELAYELLIERLGFPREKLFATVYAGDPGLNLPPDEESLRIWERVGMPADHLVMKGEDNFWGPAGTSGPCGPCTEVFFDTGAEHGPEYRPGGHFDDASRYIEIWNAGVFMELEKRPDGSFIPLKMKSVDTGSGLERMEMVLGGHESLYDTGVLRPVHDLLAAKFPRGSTSERDLRVMTDHLRASAFILAEGVAPRNEGAGYIVRRLIRRVAALGLRSERQTTDFSEALNLLVDVQGEHYPVLERNRSRVIEGFAREIDEFAPVVTRGIKLLDREIEGSEGGALPAETVFHMVTTHGVPLEIVAEHIRSRGMSYDAAEYENLFRAHQDRSRKKEGERRSVTDLVAASAERTEYVEAPEPAFSARVVEVLPNGEVQAGDEVGVVTERTPFYGESGGQVGDVGRIFHDGGEVEVTDTQVRGGKFVHVGRLVSGTLRPGDVASFEVDMERRARIAANHTATHLLHAALHRVVGTHATQRGSRVDPDRLRFDFQHDAPLTAAEIAEVEVRVNRWVRENLQADIRWMGRDEATASGAMALFSENYGDRVRVVRFGDVSVELCGGTHLPRTGDIGYFTIVSEASVARGIRRVEALTGGAAVEYAQEQRATLRSAAALLNTDPAHLGEQIQRLKDARKQQRGPAAPAGAAVQDETTTEVAGLRVVTGRLDADSETLAAEAERRRDAGGGVVVLAGETDGRVNVVVAAGRDAAGRVSAADVLRAVMPHVDGKGGGRPDIARGGGKNPAGIAALLAAVPGAVG